MYHAAIREVMFDVCLAGLFDVGVNPELFIMWNKLDGCVCFFFQAEDGIRDKLVTGVQTCALPISVVGPSVSSCHRSRRDQVLRSRDHASPGVPESWRVPACGRQLRAERELSPGNSASLSGSRSEERRVGKECRCGWGTDET